MGIKELNIATLPTGLQLSSLLYSENPIVEIAMSSAKITSPVTEMWGRVPPSASPGMMSNSPPMARL